MKFFDILYNAHWITKSIIVMFGFGLFILIVPVFARQGVKSEAIMLGWCSGVASGIALLILSESPLVGATGADIKHSLWPVAIMAVIGITFGTALNVFLGQAMVAAPNPAYPMAISNSGIAIACLIGPVLGLLLPRLFPPMSVSWHTMLGIGLTIAGVILISLPKK